ncbi:hypothetical protein HF325_002530 [Metschnikowia pulcherrima]|uniref:RING-type domain-containing protein n=1 Tax=Metschnikowia pulcherrima TaxID=27326 RepID=A0A8H7LD68_9ASCO|nr:hypothetical protein HF325_002530 [Metschnikowia pulcherrima]
MTGPGTVLGRVQGCSHEYHEVCIMQWLSNSNLCPSCRTHFHKIDIIAQGSSEIIKTACVQDKLLATDAIDRIPAEFVTPRAYERGFSLNYARDAEALHRGVCLICSSAHYSARKPLHGNMYRLRRSVPYCVLKQHRWLLVVLPHASSDVLAASEPVLVDTRPQPSRLNGGLLLRKQARELQTLSAEERSAWDVLESARRGETSVSVNALSSEETSQRRRKRPRPRPRAEMRENAETDNIFSAGSMETYESDCVPRPHIGLASTYQSTRIDPPVYPSSRLAGLLRQMQSKRREGLTNSPTSDGSSRERILWETLYKMPDSETERVRTHLGYATTYQEPKPFHTRPLTLEEKQAVQTYVRADLRLFYKPWDTNVRKIHTEAEYRRINQMISRRVYAYILDLCGKYGPLYYEKYFGPDQDPLKQVVGYHFAGWSEHE